MKVVLTDEALADLRDIGRWIAQGNPSRAVTFIGELRARCLSLADKPVAYPIDHRLDDPRIRRRNYRAYAIFHRVTDVRIEVLHIFHGARDHRVRLEREE